MRGRSGPWPTCRVDVRQRGRAITDTWALVDADRGRVVDLVAVVRDRARGRPGDRSIAYRSIADRRLVALDLAPTGSLHPPSARRRPFAIDLYRHGDFVSEARVDWCVPAAIQTMARLIDRHATGSVPSQRVLDRRSRALSSSRLVGLGSEPQGWAGVLNRLGDGPYVVVAKRSFRDAIAAAARALRLTGRPVGLLVWRGAHAWVMSGFEATADPARFDDFRVTRVRLIDPWYPRRRSAWGRTRAPDARVRLATLARSFVRWHRPTVRYAELDGRYVLVLPVPAAVAG